MFGGISKEQRMREYFITAAREILQAEGMKALNVRAIAERAGYSYATLYNYFSDIKELIFECIFYFQDDCSKYITGKMNRKPAGIERIKAAHLGYIEYFIQYPGIYELFYLEKMSDYKGRQASGDIIYNYHKSLASDDWDKCIKDGIFTKEQSRLLQKNILMQSTGVMLYYFNRGIPSSYKAFMRTVEELLNKIICPHDA